MDAYGRGYTQTAMISALFHLQREGDTCLVRCNLIPGWEMHFTTAREFLLWWRATMVEAAQNYYVHKGEGA